ncbi:TIGR01777 family protein [Lewinellaceae bacterium SD302]|nr:TIGR01777 family protein [Lewinellaceae bacterium SD302]
MANILIGGGTGFVGGFLSKALRDRGHEVAHLSRTENLDAEFPAYHWDIKKQSIDETAVGRADYLINLAGAGIADARWTEKRKKIIIDSRVNSTKLLADTLQKIDHRPKLYLSASAIGYYGDSGEQLVDESSPAGDGFLSESCVAWEDSTRAISALGIPLFINRTGIVLHPDGGAMQKMVLPLSFYTSTYFGDGRQWYSWIHMDDIVGIYLHAIEQHLTGTYNGVAPNPARNKEIAEALPKANDQVAAVLPAPAFTLKLALGEMSHTILDSCNVSAKKIEDAGYEFSQPELMKALQHLLKGH